MQTDPTPLPGAEQSNALDTDTLTSLPLPLLAVERDEAAEDKALDSQDEASDEVPEDLDEEFHRKLQHTE
jgi:hypothetical protein